MGLLVSGLQLGRAGSRLPAARLSWLATHLVFSPWDMDKTRAFLIKWLSKAGVPHVGTADKLLSASKLLEPVVLPVADIERVELLNRASLLNPPQVRLYLRAGGHLDLGILHSPTTLNISSKNNTALDNFLSKLPVPLR